MSAKVISFEKPRHRYIPSKATQIFVSPVVGAWAWQVWWWSPEYQIGIDLGHPLGSVQAAEAAARRWAATYGCGWDYSPVPINNRGEMAS